jgi:hypothetical protein
MWILQVLDSMASLALVMAAARAGPEPGPAQLAYLSGTELKMLCLWEQYGNCLEDYIISIIYFHLQ